MNDQQFAHLAVLTSLNKMMKGSHFDICCLDGAIKALGVTPDGDAYRILRPLHCVSWMDMPSELRDAVPKLIERCLMVPAYQFQITPVSPESAAMITQATIRRLTR